MQQNFYNEGAKLSTTSVMQELLFTYETKILTRLGFQCAEILVPAHRYLLPYLHSLLEEEDEEDEDSSSSKEKPIVELAWGYLNDCYRTDLCCHYAAHEIAVAALWLAARKRKSQGLGGKKLPKDWFLVFDCSKEALENISRRILALY